MTSFLHELVLIFAGAAGVTALFVLTARFAWRQHAGRNRDHPADHHQPSLRALRRIGPAGRQAAAPTDGENARRTADMTRIWGSVITAAGCTE